MATQEISIADELQLLRSGSESTVLRHDRIPSVSDPYERTPGMLRDAALLQLVDGLCVAGRSRRGGGRRAGSPGGAMVRRRLTGKPDGTHPDYDEAFFERVLDEVFDVECCEVLPSGTRVLYHAQHR